MKKKFLSIIFCLFFIVLICVKKYNDANDFLVFSNDLYNIEGYKIIDKMTFKDSFINYLYKSNDNDKYLSKIYDYETKEELSITDLIKKECLKNYYDKIEELLYLKYPYYIVEELKKNYGVNSYIFKDNELIIYFNDYNIDMSEQLLLRVNYNEIYNYLNFSVLLQNDYKNESGYDYVSDKKTVAFTFDDSPNQKKTTKLLEILRKNYATATFFMVGAKMEENKKIVSMVYHSPNEIGSHTYKHKNLKRMNKTEMEEDNEKFNSLYNNITDSNIKLFRPPYGIIDKNYNMNVSYVLWSIDTLDWKYRISDNIVNIVLDNIKDGDIILFHDSYDSTILAVEKLLPILHKQGFQVVSVSKLAELKNKTLEHGKIYYNFS